MKNKPEWLDRALFVSSNFYCLCTNEKMFHKAMDHLKIKENDRPNFIQNAHSSATVHFFVNKDGGRSAIVCIRKRTKDISYEQIVAMLVHEAVHLWQETRDNYGEKSPSSELEAYAIQSLSQRLIESYNRQTSKKKRVK